MKNRVLKQLLAENGFMYLRSRGDHHTYQHPHVSKLITICGDDGHDSGAWQESRVLSAIRSLKRRKK